MKHSFACPKCGTRFQVNLPDMVRVALCPSCGTPIPVAADEFGSLNMNLREAVHREGNWILWAAGIFALIWGLIVAVMIIVNHKSAPSAVSGTAPPAPVASTPAPTLAPPLAPVVVAPPPAPVPAPAPPTPAVAPVVQTPPPEIREVPKNVALTDADIIASINKGVGFLLTNFANGELKASTEEQVPLRHGMNALAIYALLHCGQSVHDDRTSIGNPAIKMMIDRMKHHPMTASEAMEPITYSRSLRASALSIYNRPEDRDQLLADLAWLLKSEVDGAYTYDDDFIRPGLTDAQRAAIEAHRPPNIHSPNTFYWDNSNSQYGLIGAWNCAEAGLSVPNAFWQDVERHWLAGQFADGTWSYDNKAPGTYSMTMAGITALSICRDFMNSDSTSPPLASDPNAKANAAALDRAITWLETGDNSVNIGGSNHGYSLYGLERAALASGMMFAGTHDIYRELAKQEVESQATDGSWGMQNGHDAIIQTAFDLLFLARGRNPVLMNKLRYDGNWANHPRDAANLSRFASYAMERPVNWQSVTLHQRWQQWLESPILYISGDKPPTLGEADYERLRAYADNGGLIFTHSDNGSASFNAFARDLAAKLFPKYEMVDVPDNDDLFTLQFNIPSPHAHFRAVSNGSRRMMLHCSSDIAAAWQINNSKRDKSAFELGMNLCIYANGKADLRSKTDSPYINEMKDAPRRSIGVARLKYAGNWDPEPAAWVRFSRYFAWDTGWSIVPVETPVADVDYSKTPFAYLSGTAPDRPTDQQSAALKKFVADGGTLFIEASGGSKLFDEAAKRYWIPAIVPNPQPQPIGDADPILTGKLAGLEPATTALPRILLRPYAAQVAKPPNIRLLMIPGGKGRIILSDLDLTTGLLGTNIWGVNGYAPAYAQAVLKNVILQTEVLRTQQN